MIYRGHFGGRPSFGYGFRYKSAVLQLIIINAAVFLFTLLLSFTKLFEGFVYTFSVVPKLLTHRLYLWQFITYMFLHSVYNPFHIIINMLMLFFLGRHVEASIGRTGFLKLYFAAGVGAALIHVLTGISSPVPMLGASGAVFGVMMAFAMLAPERPVTLLLWFVFPVTVKAKYLVLGFAIIEFLSVRAGGNVAHWAHLGGLLFGYIFMKAKYKLPLPWRLPWMPRFQIRIKGDREQANKYRPMDDYSFISEEVDPILEKISRQGMRSLTRKERQILKKAHARMKDSEPH